MWIMSALYIGRQEEGEGNHGTQPYPWTEGERVTPPQGTIAPADLNYLEIKVDP